MKKLLIASALGMSFLFGGVSASAVYPGSQSGGSLNSSDLRIQAKQMLERQSQQEESGSFPKTADGAWTDQEPNVMRGGLYMYHDASRNAESNEMRAILNDYSKHNINQKLFFRLAGNSYIGVNTPEQGSANNR